MQKLIGTAVILLEMMTSTYQMSQLTLLWSQMKSPLLLLQSVEGGVAPEVQAEEEEEEEEVFT